MRRQRDRRPRSFFRGGELPRLAALVVMLAVLVMLMLRARDPQTWSWIAPDEAPSAHKTPPAAAHANQPPREPVTGLTDLDPQEREAAEEELQAVTDKAPLAREEMPIYWRLLAWSEHQSADAMLKRARREVTFRELWQQPEKYRGQLVQLRLHLRRTATVADVADNPLGLSTLYEAWGWNSDSQPYWYWLVAPELPPEMPTGNDIYAEATFVGYFLKLLPYEDRTGKTLATPLLMGRLVWHPTPAAPLAHRDEWRWPWYVAGTMVVLFALRWGLFAMLKWRQRRDVPPAAVDPDEQAIESWLAGAEESVQSTPNASDLPGRRESTAD